VYGLGIKEKNFYEKNKVNSMKDKNKEIIKILEENKLTNIYSPEDKILMEIDNLDKQQVEMKFDKQIDHTKVDDRGPLDLTRQIEETDKRIKELDNSLSIALEINDTYQRDNVSLAKQVSDKNDEISALKIKLELLDNKTQK
tara:strand:+ start:834 stop:1259 length:426 start_codon:yes stop_codon:yes gene_type:complete